MGQGLGITASFDGSVVHFSDYLDTYRTDGAYRPFMLQRAGKRFVTAPEDGSGFELAPGDRVLVDTCVYVLRGE